MVISFTKIQFANVQKELNMNRETLSETSKKATLFVKKLFRFILIGYEIYDNCDNKDITTDLLFNGEMVQLTMDCDPASSNTSGFPIGKSRYLVPS